MKQSEYKRIRNVLIELGGTAALVYMTNWANVLYELEQIKLSSLALVYGLMVSILIYVAQDKSGAHFDPSVTVAKVDAAELPVVQQAGLLAGDPVHPGADRRRSDRGLRDRQTPHAEPARTARVLFCNAGRRGRWGSRRRTARTTSSTVSSWRRSR
jgi:hypothetical protein